MYVYILSLKIAKKTLDKATKIYEDSSVCYGLSAYVNAYKSRV